MFREGSPAAGGEEERLPRHGAVDYAALDGQVLGQMRVDALCT